MMKAPFLSFHAYFLTFLCLIHHVLAFIWFSSPSAGAMIKGDSSIEVTWEPDDMYEPLLPTDARFDLLLCAGGDDHDSQEQLVYSIKQGKLADGRSVSVDIDRRIGGDYANAYFLRMVLDAGETSVVVHSSRFTLTNMTGTFHPRVSAALESISGTDGPPAYRQFGKRQGGGDLHDVSYADQTGATRYAPMPKLPGTKISIKAAKPLFPTSSYDIATTFLPPATIETTIPKLAPQTVTSIENTAAAAPRPTDDMEKFLNRWKD